MFVCCVDRERREECVSDDGDKVCLFLLVVVVACWRGCGTEQRALIIQLIKRSTHAQRKFSVQRSTFIFQFHFTSKWVTDGCLFYAS